MKTGIKLITAVSAFALMGNAVAASISIPASTVAKGTTSSLELAYTGDATSTNLDFTINYDEAVVDEAGLAIDCSAGAAALGLTALNCSIDTTNNQIKGIGVNFSSTALTSADPFATITLPILDGAATGASDNTFSAGFYDVGGSSTGDQVDVAWSVTVTDGPQAVFGSNPAPAAGVSMSGQVTNIIAADVIVNNDNGDAGSTLTYSCAETADVDNVFTLAGDITNHPVAVGSTGTVSVACDSGTVGTYTGAMECTHNGASSPDTFALNCTVNAGPEPAFDAVADVTLAAAQEGDADPTGSVSISNTGDTGTTLTGTCSLTGPDAQISLTGGAFSVAQGGAAAVVGLSCNASAEGDYTNSVSCAHNGTNVATPQVFPVTCSVGPAGGAIYLSAPALGSTIEMTPTDVPAGTAVPDQTLTINNAATDPADNDLILSGCAYTGDAAITVGAAPSSPIAPNGMSTTTFSCDTTTVGDYTGTYACDYSVDGGTTTSSASYPVHCGVRAAGSEITFNPTPGVINIHVPMNGTGFAVVNVSEILDEGLDASIDSCTLADGANFALITTFPLAITAGGSALIEVSGTDPMDGSLGATDVLTCIATDTVNGTTTNVWDLNLTVQTAAIPTLSTWGLLAMFLTMFGLGGMVIRRKESS